MEVVNFTYTAGDITVHAYITNVGISALILGEDTGHAHRVTPSSSPVAARLHRALDCYFAGKPESFQDLPLDLDRHTAFRRQVWDCARRVPWGATTSYGGLCTMMARTAGTARAVGQALGANPVPIIIPCHRILASDNSLGGFSCGLEWKKRLLKLEGYTF